MKDGILKATGNSRFLRSVEDFRARYPDYNAFGEALASGTLPIDLNGLNPDGWQQIGSYLNKANLLPDSTAIRLGLEPEDDPQVKDAFLAVNYQVGDILTTRRKDLGPEWALCNGDVVTAYEARELYEQSLSNGFSYDAVTQLTGLPSLIIQDVPYSFELDTKNMSVYIYRWEASQNEPPEQVLIQSVSIADWSFAATANALNTYACEGWIILEVSHTAQYSTMSYLVLAAPLSDPSSFSRVLTGSRPGDSGSGIGVSAIQYCRCKVKADGTCGVVVTCVQEYSNSSGTADRFYAVVLEERENTLSLVSSFTTGYFDLVATNYAHTAVLPFWNPYLQRLQFAYTTTNDSTGRYYYLYSVDIISCYASGVLARESITNPTVWSNVSSTYGVSYDNGQAVYLIPSTASKGQRVMRIVSTTSVTSAESLGQSGAAYELKNGDFWLYTGRSVRIYDSFDAFLSGAEYTKEDFTNGLTNCMNGFGLYALVGAGPSGFYQMEFTLPVIAPDKSFAYIKIKERVDDD